MKQQRNLPPKTKKKYKHYHKRLKEHGGSPSNGRRRSRRSLNPKYPLHVTLRSEYAYGGRCLLKHRKLIYKILSKASERFQVKVYEKAICGNHIHLLVKGQTRFNIQNFFRVVAGHIAQQILLEYPILVTDKPKRGGARDFDNSRHENTCKHPKNQRKFWCALIYSRLMAWGRDFANVTNYIIQNTLEALQIIPYQPRKRELNSHKISGNKFKFKYAGGAPP